MGFLLRREEVLNVEQLQRMLDDSPSVPPKRS